MWKNRLCYLALLVCATVFLICFDGYLSLYVWAACLALPGVSLVCSLPGMLGARLSLSVERPWARKGEAIPLRLRVWNAGPFPSGRLRARLTVENTLTGQRQRERFSLTAAPRPQVVEHRLSSQACGWVTCRLERPWVCDYLGLFALPVLGRAGREAGAFFWPGVHPLFAQVREGAVPDSEGERYSQARPGDDPTELFALRDWREGDRLSRVHWKLSRKLGRPLVKELGRPLSDHRLFVLDMNGTGQQADTLLDAFASLSCFLAEREVPHRVLYWQPAAQALACREVVSPQDLPPLWQEILAAGGKAPLPPLEQEALPQGVSHAVYLCCRPQRAALLALQARWPAARRTVLWSGEWEGDPLPAGEARSLGPGRLTEDLSGLVL